MIKYLVCPGKIQSANDGEWHYVSARDLIRLYGVNPKECIENKPAKTAGRDTKQLFRLYPSRTGFYPMPKKSYVGMCMGCGGWDGDCSCHCKIDHLAEKLKRGIE